VDVNPAAQRLTGMDRKALRSLRVGELFTCTEPHGLAQLVEALHKTGFFHSREGYLLRRREGPAPCRSTSVSAASTPSPSRSAWSWPAT
jgi:hypothetical protein